MSGMVELHPVEMQAGKTLAGLALVARHATSFYNICAKMGHAVMAVYNERFGSTTKMLELTVQKSCGVSWCWVDAGG